MNNYLKPLSFILFFSLGYSQNNELKGLVFAQGDLENIHVINKTSKKNTTTNAYGEFVIEANPNDTLLFSSIQYKKKIIIISASDFKKELFFVSLEDEINELDEVIIGKVLTGNLSADITNLKIKRKINFYDVGITGYKGIKASYSERLLNVESSGGGPIISLINTISGKKKKLKQYVFNEKKDKLRSQLEAEYTEAFFSTFKLNKKYQKDFFYFCAEQDDFLSRCQHGSRWEIIKYLQEKLIMYKTTLALK